MTEEYTPIELITKALGEAGPALDELEIEVLYTISPERMCIQIGAGTYHMILEELKNEPEDRET